MPLYNPIISRVIQQLFAASGTYTPTPGMLYAEIEMVGGGGGSGGCANSTIGHINFSGAGGGGEYSRIIVTAAQVGGSQSVIVGAAGAAGVAGNNAGGAGVGSSVGSLCTANGGGGGSGQSGAANANGGAGGSGGTGSQMVGQAGAQGYDEPTLASIASAPPGGRSFWGHNVQAFTAGAAGPGTGFGAGGSGAFSVNGADAGGLAGKAGSIGFVRITEHCR